MAAPASATLKPPSGTAPTPPVPPSPVAHREASRQRRNKIDGFIPPIKSDGPRSLQPSIFGRFVGKVHVGDGQIFEGLVQLFQVSHLFHTRITPCPPKVHVDDSLRGCKWLGELFSRKIDVAEYTYDGAHSETTAATAAAPTYAALNETEEVGKAQVRIRLGGQPVGASCAGH